MVDTAVSLGVESYIVDLGFSAVTPFRACCFLLTIPLFGFPGGPVTKTAAANAGDRVWSLGWEDALEEEMATRSSILAWRIPWTEEPGGLQSMVSQKQWDTTEWLNNDHLLFLSDTQVS